MNQLPGVLGMRLDDAKALLGAEGLVYRIIETKPVKRAETNGPAALRVIRVLYGKEREAELVVCSI